MQSSRFCISLCFFLSVCIAPAFSSSSPSINGAELYSLLSFSTPYYTGEESLIGKLPHDTIYYNFVKKFATLQIQQHSKTNDKGVYDVRGYLFIQFPFWYGGDPPQSVDDGDGSRRASRARGQGDIRFWLNGLWSERMRQLVMVGTGSWVIEGKPIILDVFLKLNYTARNNPTRHNSYISGTLSSLVVSGHDPGYFDPFSIFSFPTLPDYNYSLLSQVQGTSLSNFVVAGNERPSYEGDKYCWVIMGESILLKVEYAEECSEDHHQHCSPLGTGDGLVGSLPRMLLFTPIQCSAVERKMRYMVTFQNTRYDQGFGLNSTVIGEASWDGEKKELFGIACRLLDPLNRSANEVGDCTMRLILRYTSIFTVRNEPKLVGQFRSTRRDDKSGYFRKINLTKSDEYGLISHPHARYEYTKLDEVRRSCAVKKPMKSRRGKMNTYPDVTSDNMGFELSVENSKGQNFAWISASPLWVGDHIYRQKNVNSVMQQSSDEEAEISKPYHTNTSHSHISYMITFSSSSELEFGSLFESLNWSMNGYYEVEITAEGVYDAETGYLCMVGCRNGRSSPYISRDCKILVTLQFAPMTGERAIHTKGTIMSTRPKTDPLHFEEMIITSASYYAEEVERAMWRMDIEITMVVISNTFICIFVALQIFHVRRNSKVPSYVSLFMLLILSVGHMIPLVSSNLQDDYLRRNPIQNVTALKSGRLVSNEVTVRLSSLVPFLLQLRLLQLVWTAKQRDVNGGSSWERKPGFILLSLYAVGALLTLLLNCTKEALLNQVNSKYSPQQKYNVLEGFRSYGGLIMDGFLLPQVLLNSFTGSTEKALSPSFYGGISAVRMAPHAYSLYRLHNYPALDLRKTYYFANPDIGFYSIASDSIVPFVIIMLAVIIYLQQHRRGSCPLLS